MIAHGVHEAAFRTGFLRGPVKTGLSGNNRNKRSAMRDLADPADLRLAAELASRADMLGENFLLARRALDAL